MNAENAVQPKTPSPSAPVSPQAKAQPAAAKTDVNDVDRDSLHILPLSILPLKTSGLKRARMIKNAQFRSVIELFSDLHAGSGQLELDALPREFSWAEGSAHDDMIMLRKLAQLPTYDVYSLRIQLRELGIKVEDHEALKLSKKKSQELTDYMVKFTHPLIIQIYGGDDVEIKSFEDIVRLFRHPDIKKAAEKMKQMAATLEIEVIELPKFLEDYGDIFLSLSYYRQCLDAVMPAVQDFLDSLRDIRNNWQLKHDLNLMKTCDRMEKTFNGLVGSVNARFNAFDQRTRAMWDNLSAETFHQVEELIQSCHVSIGGALCALTVKMDAWTRLFPHPGAGGPVKRGEFMMQEMRQGLERMEELLLAAPMARAGG